MTVHTHVQIVQSRMSQFDGFFAEVIVFSELLKFLKATVPYDNTQLFELDLIGWNAFLCLHHIWFDYIIESYHSSVRS